MLSVNEPRLQLLSFVIMLLSPKCCQATSDDTEGYSKSWFGH